MYMYVCMSKELIQNIDGTLAMLKKKHWWIVMAWLWSGRSVPQVWPQERLLVFFFFSASWIPAAVHVQAFIHTHILNLLLSLSPSDLFKKDSTSISDLMNTDRKHYNLSDTCSHFISSFVLLLLVSGGLCLLSFEREENVMFSSVEKIMCCWCVWDCHEDTGKGGTDDGERGVSCDMTKLLRQVGRCVFRLCCCYW